MLALLLAGAGLVVLAIALVAVATSSSADPTGVHRSIAVLEAMTGAPPELTKEIEPGFKERVLEPLQQRAFVVGRRLTGSDTSERLRHKLDLAGNPGWTVEQVISMKVIGAVVGVVGFFFFALLLGRSPMTVLLFAVAGLIVGFFAPNLYLYQLAYDRSAKLGRGLPDAIDLLTISVEAGLGFDAAIQQVARNTDGPLALEFARVLREMQIGAGRAEALRGLAERTNLPELRSFVSALVQADSFGIPIGQVLRVQSHEIRVKRRQRAEEKAQQVPVKITVPLIFCILPCLFVAVLGPAVISIMHNVMGR